MECVCNFKTVQVETVVTRGLPVFEDGTIFVKVVLFEYICKYSS